MTSLYPETTGIYFLDPDLAASPVAKKNTLLPRRFEQEGYDVTGAGKIFHGHQNEQYLPSYGGSFGRFGPAPAKKLSSFPGMRAWDWGVYPKRDEDMPDHKIAAWAVEQLQKKTRHTAVSGRRILSTACATVCSAEVVRSVSNGVAGITCGAGE